MLAHFLLANWLNRKETLRNQKHSSKTDLPQHESNIFINNTPCAVVEYNTFNKHFLCGVFICMSHMHNIIHFNFFLFVSCKMYGIISVDIDTLFR